MEEQRLEKPPSDPLSAASPKAHPSYPLLADPRSFLFLLKTHTKFSSGLDDSWMVANGIQIFSNSMSFLGIASPSDLSAWGRHPPA